eukprot:2545055-Prorocentrum_lima.AAC.1
MTSSLVGSEMCIRDRQRKYIVQVALVRAAPLLLPCETLFAHDETLSPVSYTHLTLPTICSV